MPETGKTKAVKAVQEAQRRFERDSESTQRARQNAFAEAQAAGLSLREIGKAVGLHHSRIAEIIRGQ